MFSWIANIFKTTDEVEIDINQDFLKRQRDFEYIKYERELSDKREEMCDEIRLNYMKENDENNS